jgi:hypothetical protein
MKNKRTKLIALLTAIMPIQGVSVYADPEVIPLELSYEDPTTNQGRPQKGPVLVPEVAIEDYTLYFDSSCYGCTLRLVDENDNVVYTTIIIGDTLVLPSTLSGEYELQLIFDDCYFHGIVEF